LSLVNLPAPRHVRSTLTLGDHPTQRKTLVAAALVKPIDIVALKPLLRVLIGTVQFLNRQGLDTIEPILIVRSIAAEMDHVTVPGHNIFCTDAITCASFIHALDVVSALARYELREGLTDSDLSSPLAVVTDDSGSLAFCEPAVESGALTGVAFAISRNSEGRFSFGKFHIVP
jgi:hypothetical protein